jgi:hypothetical protein
MSSNSKSRLFVERKKDDWTPLERPGKYLAIDCEMVGVGIDGSESSLARVSLVDYHGVVQLDEYVKQREKVVDYRTRYSGIRDADMVKGTLSRRSSVVALVNHNVNQLDLSTRCRSEWPSFLKTGL